MRLEMGCQEGPAPVNRGKDQIFLGSIPQRTRKMSRALPDFPAQSDKNVSRETFLSDFLPISVKFAG